MMTGLAAGMAVEGIESESVAVGKRTAVTIDVVVAATAGVVVAVLVAAVEVVAVWIAAVTVAFVAMD